MPLGYFDVDLVTIVMAYLLISYGQTGACIFAFGLGLLIDIFSGGLLGLFTLIYMTVFLGINLGSRFFHLHSPRGLFLLVTSAVLLKEVFFTVLLTAFDFEIIGSSSAFVSRATSALCSGLIAPFVFYVLNRTNRFFSGGAEETG
jgi:rod shape-determining protein MreD